MASFGNALISGTAYEVTGGNALIGGTAYAIQEGKVLIDSTTYVIGTDGGSDSGGDDSGGSSGGGTGNHTITVSGGMNLTASGTWKGYVLYGGTKYTSGTITANTGETIQICRQKVAGLTSVTCMLTYKTSASSSAQFYSIAAHLSTALGTVNYTLQGVSTNITFSTVSSGGGEIM